MAPGNPVNPSPYAIVNAPYQVPMPTVQEQLVQLAIATVGQKFAELALKDVWGYLEPEHKARIAKVLVEDIEGKFKNGGTYHIEDLVKHGIVDAAAKCLSAMLDTGLKERIEQRVAEAVEKLLPGLVEDVVRRCLQRTLEEVGKKARG